MGVLSFELSGLGENAAGPLDLAAVQQLALDAGFAKPDVGDDKPLSVRADRACARALRCVASAPPRAVKQASPPHSRTNATPPVWLFVCGC